MKLTRLLAWIRLALGCIAAAIADPDGHVLEAVSPAHTQALNVKGGKQ